MKMKVEERLSVILGFNKNLAYSLLELVDMFPWPKRLRVLWALARLEKAGLIESKRIGLRKYYHIKETEQRRQTACIPERENATRR